MSEYYARAMCKELDIDPDGIVDGMPRWLVLICRIGDIRCYLDKIAKASPS